MIDHDLKDSFNPAEKTGWTEQQRENPVESMLNEIVQVLGEFETQKRTLFEKVEDVHADLVSQRKICPLGGCAGSMGCVCPC